MGQVVVAVQQGEVWWGEAPDTKGRPLLVVHRSSAAAVMDYVLVAPVTTRRRSTPAELSLGVDEGLRVECVANFDDVRAIWRDYLTRRLGSLSELRRAELCERVSTVFGCG